MCCSTWPQGFTLVIGDIWDLLNGRGEGGASPHLSVSYISSCSLHKLCCVLPSLWQTIINTGFLCVPECQPDTYIPSLELCPYQDIISRAGDASVEGVAYKAKQIWGFLFGQIEKLSHCFFRFYRMLVLFLPYVALWLLGFVAIIFLQCSASCC